eukprot:TRINITY_DN516_c0_g1_i1.p1 TRINITY_DN516_c0_g1~~TRINITY_DN516_c0_g1_i1.p1  ORF type:complete len:150 (-),score=18.09 TRINITY_DN516_c0_g1_i1:16-465(-)
MARSIKTRTACNPVPTVLTSAKVVCVFCAISANAPSIAATRDSISLSRQSKYESESVSSTSSIMSILGEVLISSVGIVGISFVTGAVVVVVEDDKRRTSATNNGGEDINISGGVFFRSSSNKRRCLKKETALEYPKKERLDNTSDPTKN